MASSRARKRVLVIAYHFPPVQGSSGVLRTLKFVRYLPEFGYDPTVLTVNPRAYPSTDGGMLGQIPKEVAVHRTFALDAQRHMSIKGRYPGFLSIPDRFSTWIPFGVIRGLRLIASGKIDAIFSTYPIPSAHVIGYCLARLSGKPWLSDFRDPMWDEYSQTDVSAALRARRVVEKAVVARSSHVVVNTDGMGEMFAKRYPRLSRGGMTVIPNGYDENDFSGLTRTGYESGSTIRMIHAGLLEPSDRDPIPFFRGVKAFLDQRKAGAAPISISLYAPGNEKAYQADIRGMGLEHVISILSAIPYGKMLAEMGRADILLLFQGPSCDNQIPAKLYEYMRVGKPILTLGTHAGSTGRLVTSTGSGLVVPHDDSEAIARTLAEWVEALENGLKLPQATMESASRFSRQSQARVLAQCLDNMLTQA